MYIILYMLFYPHTEYYTRNVKWNKVCYDHTQFLSFYKRYKLVKLLSYIIPYYKTEYKILHKIYVELNSDWVDGVLSNNEYTIKYSIIEIIARKGVLDILLNGKYTYDTYDTISNLPYTDYKLVSKRIQELMELHKNPIQTYSYPTSTPE